MRPTTGFHITGTSDDGLVHPGPCRLERVVLGTELGSGTLKVYDVAAVADAAAGNLVASIKTDTRGVFDFGLDLRVGLVVIASGTLDATVVWG